MAWHVIHGMSYKAVMRGCGMSYVIDKAVMRGAASHVINKAVMRGCGMSCDQQGCDEGTWHVIQGCDEGVWHVICDQQGCDEGCSKSCDQQGCDEGVASHVINKAV